MKICNNLPLQTCQTPAFSGNLSQKLLKGGALRKFSDAIEYDGYSMTSASLLALFYGAVIVPRYVQAYDKYDRNEIIRRDLISLTALVFLARALSKSISQVCSKASGFVLNHKPEGFNKLGTKIWNYINPESEFSTLKSDQIVAKYSKVDEFKNGIVDFCEFIHKKGGNINKVLSFNETVKANTEKILGKPVKNATYDEIVKGFEKAKGSSSLKSIYEVFSKSDNPFVKHAKIMNSGFGFVSTFFLVPALIVWIAKSNEKMTKERIAKDLAVQKAKQKQVV